jgi:PAS domain S-box-containing protein
MSEEKNKNVPAASGDDPGRLRREIAQLRRNETRLQRELETLRRDNELFRALIDHVPDHIYFKDAQSRFIKTNPAWAKDRGLDDPHEAVGKTDFDFFPKRFATRALEEEKRIRDTGRPIVSKQEKTKCRDGWRYFSATKIPVYSDENEPIGTCGITREITQLIQTENMLASERNLLFTLIDNLPDYIYIKDRNSRFRISNTAHLAALGIDSREELHGKSDFDVFSRALAGQYYEDEQRVIQSGEALLDKEEQVFTASGEQRWLSTTKVPFYDAHGRVDGIVGISRDITNRKRMEEKLRLANETLEQRVKERTRELRRTNEDLKTSLSQLRFLNINSFYFSKFVDIKRLCKAIVKQFISRLDTAECVILIKEEKRYRYQYATTRLRGHRRVHAAEAVSNHSRYSHVHKPVIDTAANHRELVQYLEGLVGDLPFYCYFPLVYENKVIAKLWMLTTRESAELVRREETVYSTLAAHGASCLNNALYYKEFSEKARLEGEIEAARHIQQQFTPTRKPEIAHIDIKGAYYPAYEIGGDYLDYFQQENGNWIVVIADVCGKGVPAALVMTMLRSSFRVEGRLDRSAKQILSAVNKAMQHNLDDRSFITASCVVIDKQSSTMTYARAGHPMLVQWQQGSAPGIRTIRSEGVAFGIVKDAGMFDSLLEEVSLPLHQGNRFVLYTDGVTDAANDKEQSYGQQRLFEQIEAHAQDDSETLVSRIVNDVTEFSKGGAFRDDLTLLSMRVV